MQFLGPNYMLLLLIIIEQNIILRNSSVNRKTLVFRISVRNFKSIRQLDLKISCTPFCKTYFWYWFFQWKKLFKLLPLTCDFSLIEETLSWCIREGQNWMISHYVEPSDQVMIYRRKAFRSILEHSSRGRYPALGHFSFSNFFKLLAELNYVWKFLFRIVLILLHIKSASKQIWHLTGSSTPALGHLYKHWASL